MVNWMDAHNLSAIACAQGLAVARKLYPSEKTVDNPKHDLGITEVFAWRLAYLAFEFAYPSLADTARTVYEEAPKCLLADSVKYPDPFTYDLGRGTPPFVSSHFQGNFHDVMSIAHEFGHAVQIVQSNNIKLTQSKSLPPVTRECCAFLSELSLLLYTSLYVVPLSQGLLFTWESDSSSYLGPIADVFEKDIADENSRYDYRWNYPLARILSVWLVQNYGVEAFDFAMHQEQSLSDLISACYEEWQE